MFAAATSTPLSEVRRMTLGTFIRHMKELPSILPLINPLAGGEGTGAPTDPPAAGHSSGHTSEYKSTPPKQVFAMARSMGMKVKKVPRRDDKT